MNQVHHNLYLMLLITNRYFKNLVEMKQEWSIAYGKQKLLNDQHMNNIAESTMCIIKDIIHNR